MNHFVTDILHQCKTYLMMVAISVDGDNVNDDGNVNDDDDYDVYAVGILSPNAQWDDTESF